MQKAMYGPESHLAISRRPSYTDVRNSAMRQEVTTARRENITQIVILGAGMDPVCFNWFRGFLGFGLNEELKRRRLTIHGFEGFLCNLITVYDVQGDGKWREREKV